MDRFFWACCVFSFIVGMFVCVQIEQARSNGCTITVERGEKAHVYIGRAD
jgi:hypothetical protein